VATLHENALSSAYEAAAKGKDMVDQGTPEVTSVLTAYVEGNVSVMLEKVDTLMAEIEAERAGVTV